MSSLIYAIYVNKFCPLFYLLEIENLVTVILCKRICICADLHVGGGSGGVVVVVMVEW